MAEQTDILDQRDPLTGAFIGSLALHGALVAVLAIGWIWMHRTRETLGDIHPAGGPAYDVAAVNKIPVPQRDAPQNPVAADTQSAVRSAPAKEDLEKKLPVPDKDAFQIPDKKKRQAEQPLHQQQYMQQAQQNQIYTRTRTAVSSPMYGASGSGQVGIGPNSPLGARLGWYAEIVRQRIAQQWLTNGLDANSQRTPAMVSFTIMRDGTVRDVRVIQPSGNPDIDNTALRAVYQSSPLPSLPPQVSDNSITAQFSFNLR